jgi:hypothetical protein
MARVERRHEEHAQQCRDAKVVPERRRQLHLLIVNFDMLKLLRTGAVPPIWWCESYGPGEL